MLSSTTVAATLSSTTAKATVKFTTAATTVKFTTVAAAAAETARNVRTAAAATIPVDRTRSDTNGHGAATAVDPEPATTTDRPPESAQDAVRAGAETPQPQPSTVEPRIGGDYGADPADKNLMANMLKSWFDRTDDIDESKPTVLKTAVAGNAAAGSKSLFERWDEASEEQERVLEDAMRSERPYADDVVEGAPATSSSSPSVLAADQNTPSRWFVLLLSGNSTVAQMRRTDFAKYLKLNLAARLSLEYDQVKINRVLVVPPRLMVNVSVVPVSERVSAAAAAAVAAAAAAATAASSARPTLRPPNDRTVTGDDDPLHNLVETNATLMELSGEEYRVSISIL